MRRSSESVAGGVNLSVGRNCDTILDCRALLGYNTYASGPNTPSSPVFETRHQGTSYNKNAQDHAHLGFCRLLGLIPHGFNKTRIYYVYHATAMGGCDSFRVHDTRHGHRRLYSNYPADEQTGYTYYKSAFDLTPHFTYTNSPSQSSYFKTCEDDGLRRFNTFSGGLRILWRRRSYFGGRLNSGTHD